MADGLRTLTASDGTTLALRHWPAAGATRRVLVVAHGMGEHSARYAAPLAPLTAAGTAIYASDHRGHGATAADGTHGDFGAGGFTAVVDDLATVLREAAAEHAGMPLVLLGHSMGSFAAQAFVLDHAELIDGLALSGSAALDVLAAATADAASEGNALEAYNAAFEPARTPFDWLSRDAAEVDRYIADPWCGFSVDVAARASMLALAPRLADAAALATIPRDLPIYVMSGLADPLAAALPPLLERYRAAGLNVREDLYPDARHELLNETNRDEVMTHLAAWLETVTHREKRK